MSFSSLPRSLEEKLGVCGCQKNRPKSASPSDCREKWLSNFAKAVKAGKTA